MKLSSRLQPKLNVLALAVLIPLITVACTSTGNSFNTQARNQLVIGETTMEQAVAILGADPVNTYRQLDGSATSIWSSKNSMLTDAIYLNQELWLAFGPDGRFQRVVKTHNLPVSSSPSRPAAQPPQASTPFSGQPVEVVSPAPVAPPLIASPPPSKQPAPVGTQNSRQLKAPAVSYPIAL